MRGGAGIAMLTPVFWRGAMTHGELIQPFRQVIVEPVAYWLVYPEYKRQQAKIIAFREWVMAELERMKQREPAEIFQPLDSGAGPGSPVC